MQHINSLPSLVFRLIFSKLPLHDLLTVGRVCALWKGYQMEIALKVNSITLLIGYELGCDTYSLTPLYLIAESPFTLPHSNELLDELQEGPLFEPPQPSPSLTIPYLAVSTVNQLVESLPNVRTLNISINGIPCHVIKRVIYLLNQWKHKLVTFKLYCHFTDKYSEPSEKFKNLHIIPKLVESLNALSSQLEHVTLDLNRHSRYLEDRCDFSFLARIREFNYTFNASAYHVPSWLTQHGNSNNTRLERIGLGGWDDRLVRELATSTPQLASKITVLPKFTNHDILPNVQILSVKHCCIGSDRQGQIFVICPSLALEDTVTREKVGIGMCTLVSTFEQCSSLRRIYFNENLAKKPEDGDDLVKFRFDL